MSTIRALSFLRALVLTTAASAAAALSGEDQTAKDDQKNAKEETGKPKFTLGKDTTYVTAPRDADGYVDYAAALSARMRDGVTPANNAFVLFCKAMGPRPQGAPLPAKFYDWLGIDPPPDLGDYFISQDIFAREHLKLDEEGVKDFHDRIYPATQRPWTAKQHPDIAGWLRENEKPLAVVVAGTQRTHYFYPLVPGPSDKVPIGLITALLPGVQNCREFAAALAARAMLHLGEGRHDAAWADLLACHRLGRHVGKGATLIEGLVGIAIEHIASAADLAYLETAKPGVAKIAACQRDLARLPTFPPMADRIDIAERFFFLDSVMMIARGGPDMLEQLGGGKAAGPPGKNAITKAYLDALDWDTVMRTGNKWYDRLVAALRLKDHHERAKQLYQIEIDIRETRSKLLETGNVIRLMIGKPETKAKLIGDMLMTLLLPAFQKVQQAGDRTEQVARNTQLAFALAAYHREHGRYPRTLEALVPKHLATVPPDVFTSKALIYRLTDAGYLLYSLGPNAQDDEGRWFDDDPPADDPSVRMPLPRLPPSR
jgi:hypothetical protein